jgi:hypothetical protein
VQHKIHRLASIDALPQALRRAHGSRAAIGHIMLRVAIEHVLRHAHVAKGGKGRARQRR